jgi:integrase
VPRLGKLPLAKLDVSHVQAFVDQLSQTGLAPRTVSHCYVTLSSALSTAVAWRLVAVNVANAVRPPRVDSPTLRVPNPDEVQRLLAAVPEDSSGAAITLIAYTGLRRGEALGLTWRDTNLETGTVKVVGSLQRIRMDGSRLELQEPKTARGRRTVTLPAPVLEALKVHRKRQLEDRILVGKAWADGDFVFTNKIGLPLDPDAFSHRFGKLARMVGLDGVRVHDLRHAIATALMARVDPRLVADTLGHASTSFTMDTYGHERDGQGAVAARAIEEALASPLASAGDR